MEDNNTNLFINMQVPLKWNMSNTGKHLVIYLYSLLVFREEGKRSTVTKFERELCTRLQDIW